MNPDNRASLPASRRLVEAGIKLETEAVWVRHGLSKKWNVELSSDYLLRDEYECIPAPCMTEIWRELPVFFYDFVKSNEYSPVISNDEGGITYAKMRTSDNILSEGSHFENTNPTDALIDLLIWARSRNERD